MGGGAAPRAALLLIIAVHGATGAGAASVSLAQALLEDMLPPASSQCAGVSPGQTGFTFDYTPSDNTSQWDETSVMYEADVFLAEMSHTEPNSDRNWKLRVGKAGNMYSFVGPFGETVPPQFHTDAPWIDEVWQSVAVHQAKNNQAPLNKPNFIHQAGAYMRDCSNADGSTTSCAAADSVEGDYMERPFYSPTLARHCNVSSCSFASWGTQAHTPTPFTSAAIYMNRYRDCGNGVLEYTQLVHNFGDDVFDYLNMPWGGVRPSVLQDLLVSQPGGAEALHKDYDDQELFRVIFFIFFHQYQYQYQYQYLHQYED